ncbi:MAG: hypothetical protein J6L85_00100 [Clostridia bacterium]|nr:hypothetical protein [Clostridia bacterium]
MYVRPPSYRFPPSVRIPENYGGNAFREPPQAAAVEDDQQTVTDSTPQPAAESIQTDTQPEDSARNEDVKEASLLSPRPFKLRLGSLFGKDRGIGTEELLIIALILLLADSDEGFDDIILMLALLFFIK